MKNFSHRLPDDAHTRKLSEAFTHIEKVVVEGLRHGFFDCSITCEITSGGKRRVCVRSGNNHMFMIPEDEVPR